MKKEIEKEKNREKIRSTERRYKGESVTTLA